MIINKLKLSILLATCTIFTACSQGETPKSSNIGTSETTNAVDISIPDNVVPNNFVSAQGRSDFEGMVLKKEAKVDDGATTSPGGDSSGDRLHLPLGASVGFASATRPIVTGDVFKASVWMWRDATTLGEDETSAVVLQIVRWCSLTEPEVSSKKVYLTDEPQEYSLYHEFKNDHDCAYFQIFGANNGTTLFAWDATFDSVDASELPSVTED